MSDTDHTSNLPQVGPWAQDKLDRLAKYLRAYTTVLSNQGRWSYIYVDAFAGAGDAVVRGGDTAGSAGDSLFTQLNQPDEDEREAISGSPRRALDIERPFSRYVFVELDPARRAFLESLQAEYGSTRDIEIVAEDCNTYLLRFVRDIRRHLHRGVVFLDPFGMQVPWSTVSAIASTGALEVFINFPVGMAIQRMLPRSGQISEAQRRRLDTYFGDPGWHAAVYAEPELDMFGQPSTTKHEGSGPKLVEWYCERLRGAFGFASDPYLVKNSKGGHLYYLIFAGPNKTGHKIAQHVLGGGERV